MTDAQKEIIDLLGDIKAGQPVGGAASFASLTGNPSDNAALGSALDAKQSEAEVQAIADAKVESEAYGPDWNGDTTHAPAKNDVYDKIEAVVASIPPAHSGGVIGRAMVTLDGSGALVPIYATGVLDGATTFISSAVGRVVVEFASAQPDDAYDVNVILVSGDGYAKLNGIPSVSGFELRANDTTLVELAAQLRITVMRLSQ